MYCIHTSAYYETYEMFVNGIVAWNNISFVNLTLKKSLNLNSTTCIKLTRIYNLCVCMYAIQIYVYTNPHTYGYTARAKTKQPISRSHFFTWLPFLLKKQDWNACATIHRYLYVSLFTCMYINYIRTSTYIWTSLVVQRF